MRNSGFGLNLKKLDSCHQRRVQKGSKAYRISYTTITEGLIWPERLTKPFNVFCKDAVNCQYFITSEESELKKMVHWWEVTDRGEPPKYSG